MNDHRPPAAVAAHHSAGTPGIARVALLVVAVLVLAWLGITERDRRLQGRSFDALGHVVKDPASAARIESDLRAARLLNPDTTPDLYRALLYRIQGRPALALKTVADVTRREPDNLSAWVFELSVVRGHSPVATRKVIAELRRLDPVGAP